MRINIDMSTNKLKSKWTRQCLIAATILIFCLSIHDGEALTFSMKGKEYGDISLQQLVSVYKDAYQQAGFEVATKAEKDDHHKLKGIKLSMRLSLPGYPQNVNVISSEVGFSPDEKVQNKSDICSPCTVLPMGSSIADGDFYEQFQKATKNAENQVNKNLQSYLKFDPDKSGGYFRITYDQISLPEFVSVYKQAYAELGFELRKMTIESNREYGELRSLTFTYNKKRDPYGGIGLSTLKLDSINSYSCPCSVLRENQIGQTFDSLSDKLEREARNGDLKDDDGTALRNFYSELEGIDYKAKDLAAEKLAKYRR